MLSSESIVLDRMVTMKGAIPLQVSSDQSVEMARIEIVRTMANGAVALGQSRPSLDHVLQQQDTRSVEAIPTDTDPREQWKEQEGQTWLETLPGRDHDPSMFFPVHSSLGR
jgi:hypothetical protein